MNAKFIAIFLCVFSVWRIVSSQKCDIFQYCNLNNCSSDPLPPDRDDENKLDRACATNKCTFDLVGSNALRLCAEPGTCTEGQYCSVFDCNNLPFLGPENEACRVGLNCNRNTLKCDKKPQCKDGEYCKRGDCEGDEKPIVQDDDACEAGLGCNTSFKCVKNSKEEKKALKWWMWLIIGFFICVLVFGILGSLWFFLYYRKNNKNIIKEEKPRLSKEKEVKDKKSRVSTVKEVKEKKPRVSTEKEVKEINSEVTGRKSASSIPGKRKSKSLSVPRRLTRSSLKPKPQDRKILKELGEW